MKLEDFRTNDLGETYIWFPHLGNETNPGSRVLLTYPNFAIKAFYLSCQNLELLEHSKEAINQGNTCSTAVALWFLTCESYINAILKAGCLQSSTPFSNYRGRDLKARINGVFDVLKLVREDFYKSGIYPKLQEFMEFRNEIFHDRSLGDERNFSKTSFSPIPFLCNQVDVVQAKIIVLELCTAFRRVLPNCDLMPDIFVESNGSFGFIKFDNMYSNLIRPFFGQALAKHALSSDLLLEPIVFTLPCTKIISKGSIKVISKALPDSKFNFKANSNTTTIGTNLMNCVRKNISFNTSNQFQLPNYMSIT